MPLIEAQAFSLHCAKRSLFKPLSFSLSEGECLALTGPSGIGKSLLARAIEGLLPSGVTQQGAMLWQGEQLDAACTARIRGHALAWLLQDASGSLHPNMSLRAQFKRQAQRLGLSLDSEALSRRFRALGLAPDMLEHHPHELSQGQAQRAALCLSLLCEPKLLIADEPSSGLDPERRGELIALLKDLRQSRALAMLIISHDQALISALCSRTIALEAFESNEPTSARGALLETTPARGLCAQELAVGYREPGPLGLIRSPRAVLEGLNFQVRAEQTLVITGMSGRGKSTLLRALNLQAHLLAGSLHWGTASLPSLGRRAARNYRGRCPLVSQDPFASFAPHLTMSFQLSEPMVAPSPTARSSHAERLSTLLSRLKLPPSLLSRMPAQLSGGELKRLAIVRALLNQPEMLLLDEPTASLDHVRALALIDLLSELSAQGLGLIVATHEPERLRSLAPICLEL
jgi:ABC-type glutathione transport system ATPase component